ncbi:MAG TPA: PAS domain S-box protein [Burkholderiales bacterium]|nr:PAS domain S-box protein [Burkholderiales bacterium]
MKLEPAVDEAEADFFDNAAIPLHWVDPDGTILRANRAELEMLGYVASEYVGRNIREFHADASAISDILERLGAGETLREYPARMRCKDGTLRDVRITSNVHWRDGRFLHTRCYTRDASDAARLEALRKETADYLEGLLEGFVAYDARWVMTYMNAAAERILGRTRDDVLGKTWSEAFPHARGNAVDAMYRRVMATRRAERLELFYDHYQRWLEIAAGPLGSGGVGVYFRDITEAREGTERLHLAQQAARLGVYEADLRTQENRWSAEMEALYGLAEGAFRGKTRADWLQLVHPEDRARADHASARALETGEYTEDFRVVWPDGTVRWLYARARVFFDAAGKPVRALGVNMDITERKQAEEALREADRRKDEFLATLGHELRNPLAPILNGLHLLRSVDPASDSAHQARAMMERQMRHLVRLVDDLLEISRITRGKLQLRKTRVDLAAVVQSALETSRPAIEAAGHRLEVSLPAEPLALEADLVRLAQVLANLLNNAAKYTDPGGRIFVGVRRHDALAVVSVQDDGIGIPAPLLERLFDMFVQGDHAQERAKGGLGIGLTLARTLVELHGGTIEARSDGPGRGSEFIVKLPLGS